MTDYLFEVISQPYETLKSYVNKFEAILRTIIDLEQHLVLTAYKRGQLGAPKPHKEHPVVSNFILDSIETYQDSKILTSRQV